MKKKALVIVCTHGNEQIGFEAFESLSQKEQYDLMIGNPRALKKNVRFTDIDQNRVGPGNPKSALYEERQVFKVLEKAKKYKYVLDIHGTVANSGIFTILASKVKNVLHFALQLPIEKIVLWENYTSNNGPVVKFVERGVGIEVGPKHTKKSKQLLASALKEIHKKVPSYKDELSKKEISELTKSKEFFSVYGSLPKEEIKNHQNKMKDFVLYKNGKESFYPVMPGEYGGEVFYKSKKISRKEIVDLLL